MFKFRDVLELFQQGSAFIEESKDQELNLFIGLTGSGKSTVVNAVLGHELSRKENNTVDFVNSSKIQTDTNSLTAVIPGTNSPVAFTEEPVPAKGDCGFLTLAVSREQVVDVLLSLAGDDKAREELCEEIHEAFKYHSVKRTAEFETLYQAYEKAGNSEEEHVAAEQKLSAYCQREDVYRMYVEAYRGHLWLGYKSILLYAKLSDITVYIWKKAEVGQKLEIVGKSISEQPVQGQVIHMLFTKGYTHFNLLYEAKSHAAKIGHGAESQTTYPTVYHEKERNCYLLDCAGFGDTRTDEHRVGINLAMESALKNAASINSVFIVINYNDLISQRGNSIIKLAKMIMSLFSNIELATKSMYFVFTHIDSLYTSIRFEGLYYFMQGLPNTSLIANEQAVEEKINAKILYVIQNILSVLESKVSTWKKANHAVWNKLGWNNKSDIETGINNDEFFQDINATNKTIVFFKMIEKALKDKVALFFNAVDSQHIKIFRNKMLDTIRTTCDLGDSIPLHAFNFTEYDHKRVKFENELRTAAWKLLQLINELNELPLEIAKLDTQITHLEHLVENNSKRIDHEGKDTVSRLNLIQEMMDEQNRVIANKQQEIQAVDDALSQCNNQKTYLESDEFETDTHSIVEKRWNYLLLPYLLGCSYTYKVFNIPSSNGLYDNYSVNAKNGSHKVLREDKSSGELEIEYRSINGYDGECTITVNYKRRFYKNNAAEIQRLIGQIAKKNVTIGVLKTQLKGYQERFKALQNTHKGDELTILKARYEIQETIINYRDSIASCKELRSSLVLRLDRIRQEFIQHRKIIDMIRDLMSISNSAKNDEFLEALKLYESEGQHPRFEDSQKDKEIPHFYRSDLTNDVMTTPIRLQTCGHVMDLNEFESILKDADSVTCPCCVKSGKDTVQIEKNDLSKYEIMHDLAKEIYGFTDTQKSLEKSYCLESPVVESREKSIASLRAMIREKQAELTSLKRELAGLIDLPKEDTSVHHNNSSSQKGVPFNQTEELRFSPILSTMGKFKPSDSVSDSEQAVSEELEENNDASVNNVEGEEENKGGKKSEEMFPSL